jgi:GDP-L-fucose synthase
VTLTKSSDLGSVLVLGHTGFLGNVVYKKLQSLGIDCHGASLSTGIDIRIPNVLDSLLERKRIKVVINCAATVGGIDFGRQHPIKLFRDNLQMTLSVLDSVSKHDVKLINPISNCVYPKKLQVFEEEYIWDGPLDESVLVYGSVRKVGWIGAWAYAKELQLNSVNLVFPNMYGPGDHLDPVRAHALGAIIGRILRAQLAEDPSVTIWGSGEPVREWMYVEDAANAIVSAIDTALPLDFLNLGEGKGISIRDLTFKIAKLIGFKGEIIFDLSKPDGAPHKTMSAKKGPRLLDWVAQTELDDGIRKTIDWYRRQLEPPT